ncbi:hypothetical protein EJB05_39950, partial [Eragrostis curvula]
MHLGAAAQTSSRAGAVDSARLEEVAPAARMEEAEAAATLEEAAATLEAASPGPRLGARWRHRLPPCEGHRKKRKFIFSLRSKFDLKKTIQGMAISFEATGGISSINNYTAALLDPSSPYDPTVSLMFLAHFVGDIHQPLHCGRTTDYGGNTIRVNWYTTPSNLHRVWDDKVIQTALKDFYNDELSTMLKAIKMNITNGWSNEEKQWEACHSPKATCAAKYADESAALACDAYKVLSKAPP